MAVIIDPAEIVSSLDISGDVDLSVFQKAIPQGWMTPPDGWPKYQLHFHLVPQEVEACKYDGGIGTYPITVSRLVPNLEVTIVDDQSGRNLASNLFAGQLPEECKSTESFTKNSLTGGYNGGALVGALADSKSFADWLVATVADLKLDLP